MVDFFSMHVHVHICVWWYIMALVHIRVQWCTDS